MIKWNTEKFSNYVRENGYILKGEYIKYNKKVTLIHDKCGNEFHMTPDRFIAGNRCPECGHKRKGQYNKKTTETYKSEVKELVGDEYTVLGKYENNKIPIMMRHNTCGHEYPVSAVNFKKGKRCPECFGKKKGTTISFKSEIKELVGDEYTVLSEYKDNKTHVIMRHNTCGHEYPVQPSHFKSGTRCPNCITEPYLEKMIRQIFEKHELEFSNNKKFNDCKSIARNTKLSFDFYVPRFKILIEADGKQHFNYAFKDTDKDLKNRISNDQIRNTWIKDSTFTFIRIPYDIDYYDIKEFIEYFIINKKINTKLAKKYSIYVSNKNKTINEKTYYTERNKNYFSLFNEGSTTIETTSDDGRE